MSKPNTFTAQQQKQEWEQECAEVAAMDFERVKKEIDELIGENYDGSDPKTDELMNEVENFLTRWDSDIKH